MKLSTWAKKQGISYRTAWRWFKAGKLPVLAEQTKTGTLLRMSQMLWLFMQECPLPIKEMI
jgi:predicted site-specific integrase-resolvase